MMSETHCVLGWLGSWIIANKGEIMFTSGLLITSLVMVLPPPGTPWNTYTVLYDWSHQFLNQKNTRLSKEPIPSPPQTQAEQINDPKTQQPENRK